MVVYSPRPVSTLSARSRNSPAAIARERRRRLNLIDARANRALRWLTWLGAGITLVVMAMVAYQIINGASLAMGMLGPKFITNTAWAPTLQPPELGGLSFIYGTLVTSLVSLVFATVLGVSIGIFLSMLAPRSVASVVGPLVEMLAAIPSVVMGLIGIVLIGPFTVHTLEPIFHEVLGFLPIFGQPAPTSSSLFTASLVLTIMVVPIISALSRDIFNTVPGELIDGAEALGATRWEVIRGVVIPTTVSGITGACVLGFGRALGEAIAVTQVVGGASLIRANVFLPGTTIASEIANRFESPVNKLHLSSLYYLALILLFLGVLTNLSSRSIAKRGVKLQ